MMSRMIVAAVVCLLLVASVSGQAQTCATNTESCLSVNFQMAMNIANNFVVTLIFSFAPPENGALFYGTGTVCSGSGSVNDQRTGTTSTYLLTALSGSVTDNRQGAITAISVSFTVTNGAGTTATGTLSGTPGSTLMFSSSLVPSTPVNVPVMSGDNCNGGAVGDPWFTGFQGQQFMVDGVLGGVMHIVSSFNVQLNARMIALLDGEALNDDEQEQQRLLSEVRHAANASVAALPHTHSWNHAGNFMGEVGVTTVGGARLFAKAGSYLHGFSKVTLDDKPLAVSDELIVLGSDVNAVTLSHPTAHIIRVQTVNLDFSLVCSDHFVNVESIHLEHGHHKHRHFGGVLGQTTTSSWKFDKETVEKEAMLESNDLFEFVAQPL